MRLTSDWVTERSSQYLIHLVKFINIQPRNNFENKKIQQNIFIKKIKTKKIFILASITNLTFKKAKSISNNFETPRTPSFFLWTSLLAVTPTFGKADVIATK